MCYYKLEMKYKKYLTKGGIYFMPNILLQDLTAMLHNTSRSNGGQFDLVHVETIIKTDAPIPQDKYWYVPSGVTSNPIADAVFKSKNMSMYPTSEEELLAGTQDIIEQAKAGNFDGTVDDASKLMMLSLMKKQSLEPVVGSTNCYRLSYDYKIFPTNGTFSFKVQLPFSGLDMVNGSVVQMSVLMPLNSVINQEATEGIVNNGQKIQELITPIQNLSRNVLSFRYNIDPLFTIVYHY
jgi:hypothetical protein